MNQILKKCFLKLGASFLLVGLVAMSTFATHSNTAHAAPCAPGTEVPVQSTIPGSANCTVGVSIQYILGELSFHSDSTVTLDTTGASTSPNFHYATTVSDDRGLTAGWRLQASYAETSAPTGGTGVAFPTLNGIPGTPAFTGTPLNGGTCVDPTTTINTTPLLLTGTPATYVTMDPGATAVRCAEAFRTNGTMDFSTITPAPPAGLYTGDITLTLLNSATVP